MDIDQNRPENPVWGSAEPETPSWGVRQTALAVAVAAVIAALGGAAIYAATGQSSQFTARGGPQPFGPPPGMAPGPGDPAGRAPAAATLTLAPGHTPLHGEFVMSEPTGGYTTMLTQTGSVTAASPSTVTVRSEDGFNQTYRLGAGVHADQFARGDAVTVRALRNGDTVTATELVDAQTR